MDVRVDSFHEIILPRPLSRIFYRSDVDGAADWALALPPTRGARWFVVLHGHGSGGDQLYRRPDIHAAWLSPLLRAGVGILTPHLRGNAWMSSAAVEDLHALLDGVRREFGAREFVFFAGSMGGTGSLMYAVRHPEDVSAVGALCPASDLSRYFAWLGAHLGGVRDEIRQAIEIAHTEGPSLRGDAWSAQSVERQVARLSMPVLLVHGAADALIPVGESRALASALGDRRDVRYVEIPGGDHDAPLVHPAALAWLDEQVSAEAAV